MKFPLHRPTLDLLPGLKGIELGAAAHNPFGVDAINVAPEFNEEVFRQAQLKLCGEITPVDLRGHAADIPVDDDSQDFVLSSHVLEHAPDLIRALVEMDRVVRPGGYVVIIFPQPDALPGDDRPLSDVEDIKRAYKEDWTFESAPEDAAFGGRGGHYWKLTGEMFKDLVASLRRGNRHRRGLKWQLIGEESPDTKVGNGFWLAYQVEK
jgi:ubiquinone/menaquinone biosynthesis C-methylase UbiE